MDVKDLNINWSQQKRIETKYGPKLLRTAEPSENFWTLWRTDKENLKKAGISVNKDKNGEWQICEWKDLPKEDIEKIEQALNESKALDADIDVPVPPGKEFYPFQKAGIKYGISRKHVLVSDEMGMGKCAESLGIINCDATISRVLVVCPATLRLNWKKEAEMWLTKKFNIGIVERSEYPEDCNFIIINYDVLRKHHDKLREKEWDIVILDEVHFLKSYKAQRTLEVFGKKSKHEENKITPIPTKKFIGLTGTPILNRPVELWPIVQAFDPENLGKSFWSFVKRYCGANYNRFGMDLSGATNLDELQRRLRESFMIRRLKKDVLTELPPKTRQLIEIPAEEAKDLVEQEVNSYNLFKEKIDLLKAEVELQKASNNIENYNNAVEKLKDTINAAFTDIAALRHRTALAKVPHVVEFLKNSLESGPVVVFAHHKDVINQLHEAFPDISCMVYGDTKLVDRQEAVDGFQAGKYNLFIGSIKAAGVGITLTRSNHAVFAELDWTPANITQSEDRLHRISQQNQVLIQHIVLENSLDARIAKTLIRKQEIIDKALDTDDIKNLIKQEPVLPFSSREHVELPEKIEELAEEQINTIHTSLKILSSMCDGAKAEDGHGFNKADTYIGKALAIYPRLTLKQANLGKRLIKKYRRQIPENLLKLMSISREQNDDT